ncbi:helix-turn-helix transcriptional regulator [Janthinobacterium sp. SUN211]|uniref:helix-turn-helix domain-containing protein n=1 Tax=Janthinobacterium sp. SUN211 TaxID=3014786 RepID=UPI0027123E77|nr:helix-turn-helix transcriptional regulator [Janthinobacterium sp. SUN211]MDO8049283.1 helix-turn-helix transcriptional regulator [Janthinobacterium sp. SUN211]
MKLKSTNQEQLLQAIGEVVRTRRVAQGLSQEAFAEVVGLHRTYVGGIERGERNVTISNLSKISAKLGISLSLLTGEAEGLAQTRANG